MMGRSNARKDDDAPMKKNRPAPKTASAPEPIAPAPELEQSPDARQPLLFGVLLGLLVVAFFFYPAAAYPAQSLLLSAVALAAAAGLTIKLFISPADRPALFSALGSLPVLAAFFFILWAAIRWRFAEVPAMGREWIVNLLAMGAALALGCAIGVSDRLRSAEPSASRILIRLVTLAAIGFGLYAFYQYFVSFPRTYAALQAELGGPAADLRTQSLLHAFHERRVGGTLGNPNLFAAQLAVFAFLSLSCIAREQNRLWRCLGMAGAALAFVATILSQSRGGLLTMLIALAGGMILLTWNRRSARPAPTTPVAVLFLAITLFAVHGAWAAHESLLQRVGNIATIRERLFYWDIALKIWARHPFIGEGPGGYPLLYLTLKSPIARESQHAHSWFFQVGSELGLIGLIPLILFASGLAGRVLSAWRRRDLAPDAPWLLGALLLLGFNGLFEFSMQWHAFLFTAGLLGGLVSGLTVPAEPTLPSPAARLRGGAGMALAAAIGLLAIVCAPPQHLSEARRFSAEDAAQAGQWGDAASEYARALRFLPDDPNLHMAYATALSRTGNEPQAWRELEAAARLNPRSAAARAAQSAWLDRQGRLEEAILKLNEAIERYPSNVQHRLDRARLSLKSGRPAQTREDLAFIENKRLPIWEYQQPDYLGLRDQAGLPPVADIPQ